MPFSNHLIGFGAYDNQNIILRKIMKNLRKIKPLAVLLTVVLLLSTLAVGCGKTPGSSRYFRRFRAYKSNAERSRTLYFLCADVCCD